VSHEVVIKRAFWISEVIAAVPGLLFLAGAITSDAGADIVGWIVIVGLVFLPGLAVALWKIDKTLSFVAIATVGIAVGLFFNFKW
jgi:hypothetical protein